MNPVLLQTLYIHQVLVYMNQFFFQCASSGKSPCDVNELEVGSSELLVYLGYRPSLGLKHMFFQICVSEVLGFIPSLMMSCT